MKINDYSYNESETDCILNMRLDKENNWAERALAWIQNENPTGQYYRRIREAGYKGESKPLFKAAFGKQQRCADYTIRNWIWTFSNEEATAVIYCLVSSEGVSWEYNTKVSTPEAVRILCEEVIDKLVDAVKTMESAR